MRPENIESIYELSPTQQGLLFHSLYSPESGMYAGQFTLTFPELNAQAFERTWQRITERHTAFRSSFFWEETDKPLQVVSRKVSLPFGQHDWRGLAPDEQSTRLHLFLAQDCARDFDLSKAPLMRFNLIRVGETAYQFIWSHHHLVLDGWSVALVLKEVFALYAAFDRGEELHLPPARPYRDYIAWLQRQDTAAAERFWRGALSGFSAPTPLAVERSPGRADPGAGAYGEERAQLPAALGAGLRRLARACRVTLNTVMQGAWALLLSRYSGEREVVFGAVVSGRPAELEGVEAMVGLFINTLPVRARVEGGEELGAWLEGLQAGQAEARGYEYSPLGQVQRWSEVPAGSPLFESILAFENYPVDLSLRRENQDLQVSVASSTEKANYPLAVVVIPKSEIIIKVNYDKSRIEKGTVERMLGHLETILTAMAADPRRRLRSIPLLTEAERRLLLGEWNETGAEYPAGRCVHHLFEAQAARAPESVAMVFGDESLTYAQLNARANQLAHHLQKSGVGPEVAVGVHLERSTEMLVALLGILKAGGAYLPLEPSSPPERLLHMLKDARSPVVLSGEPHLESLLDYGGRIIDLSALRDEIAGESEENPASGASADNLVYVMYTSGSTGKPKGISVIHRNVVRLVRNTNYLDFSADDIFIQLAPLPFDASTFEIWGSLLNGARLIVAPPEPPSLAELGQALRRYRVSTLWLTTGLFNLMVDEQLEAMEGVRHVLTGGDVLSSARAEKFLQAARGCTLTNCYGPTENTTFSTTHLMTGPTSFNASVPIGRPIANTQVYIIDGHLQPVPCGVYGNLHVGGDGLARGYIGRAALTAETFIPHPFGARPGARLYRTGDIARYLPSGEIEFLGRLDDQVKVRGFRIEAGEVEAALLSHPSVSEAVVLARLRESGDQQLVAYVVAREGRPQVEGGELRRHLREKLPEYMIPTAFVPLDSLPLNPNGKLDRRRLPQPDAPDAQRGPDYVAPNTPAERTLADIWQQVLGVERVGLHDNFFDLGGDSILSIQIVARANRAGLRLSPKHLFAHQDVASLAAAAEAGGGGAAEAEQGSVSGPVLLTPVQHWFFEGEPRRPHHFNQSVMLKVRAGTDPAALEAALRLLVGHHDALRLRFQHGAGGRWSARNAASEHLTLARVDLSHLGDGEVKAAVEAGAREAQASLDLGEGPLVRAVHFELGGGREGRLLIVIHHLAVDGVSWRILLEDLQRACEQAGRGEAVELGAKGTSFQKWAEQLHRRAQDEAMRAEMPYWTGQEWGLALPIDIEGENQSVATARTVTTKLSAEQTRSLLREVPEAYHTRVDEVLLAALGRALGGWVGEGHVVVDLEGHGREEEVGEGVELSRTVGWFTTIYPVLLRASAGEELGVALKRVKEQLRGVPRRGIGYGMLRYLSGDEAVREGMRAVPGGGVSFNYLGQFDGVTSGSGLLTGAEESSGQVQSEEAKLSHLLLINSMVRGGQLEVRWGYGESTHNGEQVERVALHYMDALRQIIAHCLSPEAGGYTPSDFPEADISQADLDELLTDLSAS